MTTQTEALKLALEALENLINQHYAETTTNDDLEKADNAITAIKEALAQPEQEPVAQWLEDAFREGWAACRDAEFVGEDEEDWKFGNSTANSRMIDLQQSTPPQRKPLTVEQLREHWQVAKVLDMTDAEIDFADYVLIARDVEALYGIKGDA